jgi:hypothetical protein
MRFTFEGTDQKVIAALNRRSDVLMQALVGKMTFLMLKLQQKVQMKLSGEVLQNREGVLFNSVKVQPTTSNETEIIGAVTAAGGPAAFGQVFEFGGETTYKIVPINKKALSFMAGPDMLEILHGELDDKPITVASVWHLPAAKRSFMAPSLLESVEDIKKGFQDTLGSVLGEPL